MSSYFEAMVAHVMRFDVDLLTQYLSSDGTDQNKDKAHLKEFSMKH